MGEHTVSYGDLDAELTKEFEAALESCVTAVQVACMDFASNMLNITSNEKYTDHQRTFVAMAGIRVPEQLAYHIYMEYVAPMSPETRQVFNKMYPDHILMMETER